MSLGAFKTTEAAFRADPESIRKKLGDSDSPIGRAALGCALYATRKRKAVNEAIPLLEEGYSIGDPVSTIMLADAYLLGTGVKKDVPRAMDMYLDLAIQGNAEAQFSYGNQFYLGREVPKDHRKAYEFISQAALQDEPRALNTMGLFCLGGICVPRDIDKAERYFRKAIDRGNERATKNLKLIDRYGRDYDYRKLVQRYRGRILWCTQVPRTAMIVTRMQA